MTTHQNGIRDLYPTVDMVNATKHKIAVVAKHEATAHFGSLEIAFPSLP